MISISDFSLWEWIKVAGSFVLFFGPGLLLLSFYSSKSKFSPNVHLTFAFGLSLGIWIILLIWLQLFNISLNKYSVRFLFSIVFLLWLFRLTKNKNDILNWLKSKENYYELIIIIFSIFIFIFYAYAYKDLVTGMGSDSMHHTLISSLIMKEGQIPKDYGPYAPVVTFSYHFGYHAYIAALSWVSGIPVRLMVVLSGAILMGLASLAGGALSYYLTKKTLIGLLSAAIIGIIYIFPAYSLLWGRYSQLMGSILLMIFILQLIIWKEDLSFKLKFSILLIITTVSFLFSHYRMLIAGGFFSIIYLMAETKLCSNIKKHFSNWLLVPLGALIISVPRFIYLLLSRANGFKYEYLPSNNEFFSFERLGPLFKTEPQTYFLFGMLLTLLTIGLYKKNHLLFQLTLWAFILGLFSQPFLLGKYMDPVTLMISSYVLIVTIISIGLSVSVEIFLNKIYFKIILIFMLIVGSMAGINRWKEIDLQQHSIVTKQDLISADWIKKNTDDGSIFMVNTYQFSHNQSLIIGTDSGYWLPIIAERQTIIPPMVVNIERTHTKAIEKELIKLHNLNGDLTTVEAKELLKTSHIDFLYYGARGGNINLEKIKSSDDFILVYDDQGVLIFKFTPKDGDIVED